MYREYRCEEERIVQVIYEAANSLDARIVAGMLESHGLECRVDGEYLQGGMGELPPVSGLVRVLVDEADVAAARELIEQRDAAFPRAPPQEAPSRPSLAFWGLMLVLLAAALWVAAGNTG
jgi:hypothetical protein